MAENRTQATAASVAEFLERIEPGARRDDARTVAMMMERLSGYPPVMWGPAIVGFDSYHYKYDSGREGDICRVGFSPRKAALTLYIVDGFPRHAEVMARLGTHKTGKSCLYVKKLADIDMAVLEELVTASLRYMDEQYPR